MYIRKVSLGKLFPNTNGSFVSRQKRSQHKSFDLTNARNLFYRVFHIAGNAGTADGTPCIFHVEQKSRTIV